MLNPNPDPSVALAVLDTDLLLSRLKVSEVYPQLTFFACTTFSYF